MTTAKEQELEYTDEQLDWFDEQEKKWRDSLPRYTFRQLIEEYPSMKLYALEKAQQTKRICEHQLLVLKKQVRDAARTFDEPPFGVVTAIAQYEKSLREARYQIAVIKDDGRDGDGSRAEFDRNLSLAREVRINEMLGMGTKRTTRCVWHNEKTASMHYYPKDNRVWCFGCNRGGDAIDVYMAREKVDFRTAVRLLNKH